MQAEIAIFSSLMTLIASFLFLLATTIYFSRKLKPLDTLGKVISKTFESVEDQENFATSISGITEIGVAAKTLNTIFQDEALFQDLLNTIASKIRTSFEMSILGTKSGDSRKRAKAEELVNNAMIEGAKRLNPAIGAVLKLTGLDEELQKDPEMFGYIYQIIQDKGLLNMLDSSMLSQPQIIPTEPKTRGMEF